MKKKKKNINIKFDFKLKLFLLISIVIILILIGLIILSLKKEDVSLRQYKSDYIDFVYDNNFKVVDDKEYIELNNKDKSATIVIKKIDYTSNAKNKDKYEIAASLSYQVIEEEKDYIETYDDYEEINNNVRYYHLYENYKKERQIEVITIFDEDYIYVVIYSADNEEFDLYSESVSIIIDSIEV